MPTCQTLQKKNKAAMKSGYVTYTGPVGKKGHSSFCWLYRNAWLWGVGWGQGGGTTIRWDLTPLPLLYTLMKAYLDSKFLPYIFFKFHAIRIQHSLRSKRLRSSYCAKVGVRERKGGGEKEKLLLIMITLPFDSSFLLSSHLCRRTRAETLTTQVIFNKDKVSSW